MENEDKKIEIHLHKEEGNTDESFISKHTPALLTFIGVVITTSLGTATVWFKPNDGPEAKIRLTKQLEGEIPAGTTLSLYGYGSNDPDGPNSELEFRWGIAGNSSPFKVGYGQNYRFAEWVPKKAGRYTIYLDVTDKLGKGKSNTDSIDVMIGEAESTTAPRIFLNEFNESGMAPFKELFDATGTLSNDEASVKYSWYVNDKIVSDKQKYEFEEAVPGRYKFDLVVKDSIGKDKKSFYITINEPKPIKQDELLILNSKEDGVIDATDKDVYVLPKRIITNGYPLAITAKTIHGIDSKIISFTNGVAKSGRNGKRGADGAYQGPQQNGADGLPGEPGDKGMDGRNSGPVKIKANRFIGNIEIFNYGEDGGNGGIGGNGGNGGQGGQGRPAKSGILDCRSGPGRGGAGGSGGDGGSAGSGGNGGNAGIVDLQIDKINDNSIVVVNTRGGNPGLPGSPGRPGKGGEGGREGELANFCGSANRHGEPGKPGSPGAEADKGKIGFPSKINLILSDQSFVETKRLIYPNND